MITFIKDKIDWFQTTILYVIIVSAGAVIIYDHSRVNKDFINVKSLLTNVRAKAVRGNRQYTAKFVEKGLVIPPGKQGSIYRELEIPTLHSVNYLGSTLGKDMIVFNGSGTAPYNTRIHGGI